MRLPLLAATLFLGAVPFGVAQDFDSPEMLLETFYASYFTGDFAFDDSIFRSAALNALYEADALQTPEGEMGALSFDPYVGGQDFELTNLEIYPADIADGIATVDVTFENFGEPRDLTYELVYENGWRIEDLVSNDPADPYRLSELFLSVVEAE